MRAVGLFAHGGPDVLQVQSRPTPVPGPEQILIEVAASGVNFKDVYLREGIYPSAVPFVLGEECAGRVIAVGAQVTEFALDDGFDLLAQSLAQSFAMIFGPTLFHRFLLE